MNIPLTINHYYNNTNIIDLNTSLGSKNLKKEVRTAKEESESGFNTDSEFRALDKIILNINS